MAVRNFNQQRLAAVQFNIVNQIRKFPAKLFRQENNADFLIGRKENFITDYVSEAIGLKL